MKFSSELRFVFLCIMTMFCSCNNHYSACINPSKLIRSYHGTTVKQQAFLSKVKAWQLNLDSLSTEMQAGTDPKANAKQQQLEQYRQAIQQKVQAEEARVNQEVLAEINAYIKQYGKEKGYDFILGATDDGNIVYAAEGKDITADVLAGLNKQYDQQHAPQK